MPIPSDWPNFWGNKHYPGILAEFISSDSLVFDIGANIGKMTWMYRGLNAWVVSVEPQKKCVEQLCATFVDDGKVHIVHAACGSHIGTERMSCYGGTTISTFVPDHYWGSNGPWKGTPTDWFEDVGMTTLDALIEEYGKPAFIKIDVEGYEYQVLQGLSQFVPLSFEFHPCFWEQACKCMARILELDPEVRFSDTVGEDLLLAHDWCGYDEQMGRIRALYGLHGKNYFGNLYARKDV